MSNFNQNVTQQLQNQFEHFHQDMSMIDQSSKLHPPHNHYSQDCLMNQSYNQSPLNVCKLNYRQSEIPPPTQKLDSFLAVYNQQTSRVSVETPIRSSISSKFDGDRMIAFRGSENSMIQNFEALAAYQEKVPNSVRQTMLFETQYQYSKRRISNQVANQNLVESPDDPSESSENQCVEIQSESSIKKPLVLQFMSRQQSQLNQYNEQQIAVPVFQEIHNLENNRYTETRRAEAKESRRLKMQKEPYVPYAALDANGISNSPELTHIMHLGANGICAIAIDRTVFLIDPISDDPKPNQQIDACSHPHRVTAVRWVDPVLMPDGNISSVQVLAVATTDPKAVIQIWEHSQCRLIRIINHTVDNFCALTWNLHLLVGVTKSGYLTVNDVRLQTSEIINQKMFGMTPVRHCTFSHDLRYLAVAGSQIQIFTVKSDHKKPFDDKPIIDKVMTVVHQSTEGVSLIAWSHLIPQLIAFGVSQLEQATQDMQNEYDEFTYDQHQEIFQVKLFNADSKMQVGFLTMKHRVTSLLWSREPESEACRFTQRLFAGMDSGEIAVIRVKGSCHCEMEVSCQLQIRGQFPILFLDESVCGNYLLSLAKDDLLLVWEKVVSKEEKAESRRRSQQLNMLSPEIVEMHELR